MSDCIDNIDLTFSIVSAEWHDKAIVSTPETILAEARENIGFEVVEAPAIVEYNGERLELLDEEGKGYKVLLANCSKLPVHAGRKSHPPRLVPLHTCKGSFQPFQSFKMLDSVLESFGELGVGAQVSSIGTLKGLKLFYVSLVISGCDKFTDPTNNEVRNYFNLFNAHNGEMAYTGKSSATRIVCFNTWTMSRMELSQLEVAVKHSKLADPVFQMEKALKAYIESVDQTKALCEALAKETLTLDAMRSIAAGYFLQPAMALAREQKKEVQPDKLKLSKQAQNAIAGIVELAIDGKGNAGRTQYDLMNGATDWWSNGGGVGGDQVGLSKRVYRSRFGSADAHKSAFISYLANPELVADGLAIGGQVLANV